MYKTKTLNLGGKPSTIHEGAMTAKAKAEGVSNSTFEQEHKGDNDLEGREARLALNFKKMNH